MIERPLQPVDGALDGVGVSLPSFGNSQSLSKLVVYLEALAARGESLEGCMSRLMAGEDITTEIGPGEAAAVATTAAHLQYLMTHQSGHSHRAIVETVKNSIDACQQRLHESSPAVVVVEVGPSGFAVSDNGCGIASHSLYKLLLPHYSDKDSQADRGKFGIGFYTTYSLLSAPSDRLVVTSSAGERGFQYRAHREGSEVVTQYAAVEANDRGTKVQILSQSFDQNRAITLLVEHFQYFPDWPIYLKTNSELSELNNLDASPEIVPNLRINRNSCQSNVVIAVGGVMLESFPIQGGDWHGDIVLNLPSHTALNPARNELVVDSESYESIVKILSSLETDKAISSKDKIAILSALAAPLKTLGDRGHSRSNHPFEYLKSVVTRIVKENQHALLPNTHHLLGLAVDQHTIYVDPLLVGKDCFTSHPGFQDATRLFAGPSLKTGQIFSAALDANVVMKWIKDDTLIINRRYTGDGDRPVVNAYLKCLAASGANSQQTFNLRRASLQGSASFNTKPSGGGSGKIIGKSESVNLVARRTVSILSNYLVRYRIDPAVEKLPEMAQLLAREWLPALKGISLIPLKDIVFDLLVSPVEKNDREMLEEFSSNLDKAVQKLTSFRDYCLLPFFRELRIAELIEDTEPGLESQTSICCLNGWGRWSFRDLNAEDFDLSPLKLAVLENITTTKALGELAPRQRVSLAQFAFHAGWKLSDESFKVLVPKLVGLEAAAPSSIVFNEEEFVPHREALATLSSHEVGVLFELTSRVIGESRQAKRVPASDLFYRCIELTRRRLARLSLADRESFYALLTEELKYPPVDAHGRRSHNAIYYVLLSQEVEYGLLPHPIRGSCIYLREGVVAQFDMDGAHDFQIAQRHLLSTLTLAKRFDSTTGLCTVSSLTNLPASLNAVPGSSKGVTSRYIVNAIESQRVSDPFRCMRELIQNSLDASHALPSEGRVVTIATGSNNGAFVITIHDNGGMTTHTVVNYLLQIGESTKRQEGASRGQFGLGFFSSLSHARKVTVVTAANNENEGVGVTLVPLNDNGDAVTSRERSYGEVSEVQLDFGVVPSASKGTTVTVEFPSDAPDIDDAFCRSTLIQICSAVDPTEARIVVNGNVINRGAAKRVSVSLSSLGEIFATLGRSGGMTSAALYVREIPTELFELVPKALITYIMERGITLDLPSHLPLTFSRNDFVEADHLLPALTRAMPMVCLQLVLSELTSDEVDLTLNESLIRLLRDLGVPTDLGRRARQLPAISPLVQSDINHLASGNTQEINPEPYLQDPSLFRELVIFAPLISSPKGERISLHELSLEVTSTKTQKVPVTLLDLLQEALTYKRYEIEGRADARKLYGHTTEYMIGDAPLAILLKGITFEGANAYQALDSLLNQLLFSFPEASMASPLKYYAYLDGSQGHAYSATKSIGINLMYGFEAIVKSLDTALKSRDLGMFENVVEWGLELLSHELQHLLEASQGWTHDVDFYQGQAQLLQGKFGTVDSRAIMNEMAGGYPKSTVGPALVSDIVSYVLHTGKS